MIVLFPMAGSLHFPNSDSVYPKPLIDINGKTMIEQAVGSFSDLTDVEFRFVIREADCKAYKLSQVIDLIPRGPKKTILVPESPHGALCSALLGLSQEDAGQELIVCNYDHVFLGEMREIVSRFRMQLDDFGLTGFDSTHPKWSYARVAQSGQICEVAEKKPIGRNALCGIYYFADALSFIEAAESVILAGPGHKDAFFVSEVFNQLILDGKKGGLFPIKSSQYFHFHDQNSVSEFLRISKSLERHNDLITLTRNYVQAFDGKNTSAVTDFFVEDSVLIDPSNRLEGKESIEKFIKKMFANSGQLEFQEIDVYVSENNSVIHFALIIDEVNYKGVDIITWERGKIVRLEAYLNEWSEN